MNWSIPLLFFSVFGLIFFMIIRYKHNDVLQRYEELKFNLAGKILLEKPGVDCETYTTNTKNSSFLFGYCDLIIVKDSFVIIGYSKLGKYRYYKKIILLKDGFVLNEGKLKKFNLNSYGGDVYLEFDGLKIDWTNYQIRIKGLNAFEKKLIGEVIS